MLVLVCGLPGTGKSTVAKELAKSINGKLLRTDIIRKEVFKKPKYTEREKQNVYELLFSRAEQLLSKNISCVLDGTFYKKSLREKAHDVAKKTGAKFEIIECICPEKVIHKRMKKRTKTSDASDADFRIYEKMKNEYEPIEEKHIVIDTSRG
jgi:predicted kinase